MRFPDWEALDTAMRPKVRSVARSVLRDQHEVEGRQLASHFYRSPDPPEAWFEYGVMRCMERSGWVRIQ